MNKVILLGRVGVDPTTKEVSNDSSIMTFTLATSETFKTSSGEKKTNTEWHKITVWNKPYLAAHISKGSQLLIEGKIRNRKYEDDMGETRYITEIEAQNVSFVGSNKNNKEDEPPF